MGVVDTNEVWYKRKVPQDRDMDKTFPRPMLNSPVREGTPDAELLVKRVISRLDGSHEANHMLEQLMCLDRNFWLRERDETASSQRR
jgi:hypothetical protein